MLSLSLYNYGQESSQKWKYHLSYNSASKVIRGTDKVYFLSSGGIFYFNELDNTTNPLTKLDGLSESKVSGIEYSVATKNLIVYYDNSMVDVVREDGTVVPISDIQRKNISGSKSIYNATCHEDYCYLSCSFGIVVLDLGNMEIKDSFIIGDNGMYQIIYDIAIANNNIYAGTDFGIKYASIDSPNLLDFNSWAYIDTSKVAYRSYHTLKTGINRLWALHQIGTYKGHRTISRHSDGIWYGELSKLRLTHDINFTSNKVIATGANWDSINPNGVYIYQINNGLYSRINTYPFMNENLEINPQSAIMDDDGTIWIADKNYGGIRIKNGKYEQLSPNGPSTNDVFAMSYSNNKLWAIQGGRQSDWSNNYSYPLLQEYSGGLWNSLDIYNTPDLIGHKDFIDILPSPSDPNHVYVATWGGGILEFKNNELVNTYNDQNSTLHNIISGKYYVRVGGLDFDSQGNLWASNCETEKVLHKKKPNGEWKSFSIPEFALPYQVSKLIVTQDDNIWMVVPRDKTKGLLVMSNDGKQYKQINVISKFSNGTEEILTAMNNINDIVEDNNGEIWVGTTNGIAVYTNPQNVFIENPYHATQPGIDENDGIYHPLLRGKTISSIAVDGGNQKWCGTSNSGLYLISPDGTQEIQHYTTKNSKLISDVITSLEYDGDNGILYVGTPLGLVSLKTDSKKSYAKFTDVYAYPNPVDRSRYDGLIQINGMMENTNVKITTISGRLVYETISVGGQATWDGKDIAGNDVHTGVYIVFCASEDGEESEVTKILFVR